MKNITLLCVLLSRAVYSQCLSPSGTVSLCPAMTGGIASPSSPACCTFYVDPSGSNSNNGTSPATAWQTISKVNAATLSPGQSVGFKAGGTWREMLTVPNSGSAGLPITFTSYGSGNPPIIAGSNLVTGWTNVTGAEYSATLTLTPKNIYEDDLSNTTSTVPLTKVASSALVATTPGSWFYSGTTLDVQLPDGSNPTGHTMEASVRTSAIFSDFHSYITVNGIWTKQVTRDSIWFVNDASGSPGNNFNENITIENSAAWNYGDGGADFSTGIGGEGWTGGAAAPPALRGWKVLNNFVGRMDTPNTNESDDAGGIEVNGMDTPIISGNTVASVNALGITTRDNYGHQLCTSPQILNNTLGANVGSIGIGGCTSAVVSGNTVSGGTGFGITVGDGRFDSHVSSSPLVSYNTIYNMTASPAGDLYNGIDINGTGTGGLVYNNTVYGVAAASMTLETSSNTWTVKNNIFDARANTTVSGHYVSFYIASTITGEGFATNLYSDLSGHLSSQFESPNGTFIAFAAFEAHVSETGGINTLDPLFTNPATGNFTLQAGSPAINAGTCIMGITPCPTNIGAK